MGCVNCFRREMFHETSCVRGGLPGKERVSMITNNFNKELRGISDALRDLGYPGCNRYDDETKIFIERHLGKNG